jgi:uncharacterized lipoprotein
MSHEQDTRGRSGAIGLAAAVTIVGLASGCGSKPSTTVPDSSVDGPAPTEPATTTPPETDNPEAGGEQDIPADSEGVQSNPGSVRG